MQSSHFLSQACDLRKGVVIPIRGVETQSAMADKPALRSRLLPIVGGYFGLSALWIAFSDRLAGALTENTEHLIVISTVKGWLFVVVTTLLLLGVLRRRDQILNKRQESLRAAAEELQAIYDGANEAIFVRETDGSARMVSCNQSACELYGYDRERFMGCRPEELSENVAPYDKASVEEWARRAVEQGPQTYEWRARRRDGTCFWAEISVRSSLIAGRRRLVFAVRDISDRKRAQEAVRRSEERFNTVFRTSPVSMIISRASDSICIDANDAFYAQTGLSSEEVVGKSVRDAPGSLWLDSAQKRQILQEVESKGFVHGAEALFRRKDGSTYTGLISFGQIVIGSDKCLICTNLDVTAQRNVEEMLHRAERLESLGVLAGGIAHDFNNLLAGAFGHLDLAREYLRAHDVEQAQESLNDAVSVFGRTRALTQQLLTFAKGGAPLRKTQVVDELVRKAVTFATSGSNCEVTITTAPEAWLCDIDGDQIGQVIDNLVINAKQAMPSGGRLQVRVDNVPARDMPHHLPARDHVHIVVRDNGAGIPHENLKRIFDPFFTTKAQGTGLGLATAYSIVHKHDGHIEVDSEPGLGSTFHIWLPRARGKSEAIDVVPADLHQGTGAILILDDEDSILKVAASVLRRSGYEASVSKNAQQAVALAEMAVASGEPFRAAILDLTIPGGPGGREIVHRLKELDPKIRILASSGYAGDEAMANPGELGFDGGLPKPYTATELRQALARLFVNDEPAPTRIVVDQASAPQA
jgi:two-component system, cell cycle sensor histidine kinase and response regulator CckA